MKHLLTLILLLVFAQFGQAQHTDTEFRSPLGIPLYLSGTFAELRGNHFHGGIDIKTNGKEGYRVYATQEGFVSRIKVSAGGYGNAVYIQHPSGYTTVYGHLSKFNDELANYVKQQQYNKQSFGVDLYFKANQFPVEKGEVIALSGNSGSSGGPHLHYEIRKTNGQIPINPLKFTNVKDDIKPTIYGVRIHNLSNGFYQSKGDSYQAEYVSSGQYRISAPIVANDNLIGISVKAIDKLNGASNSNGFVSLKMYANDQLQYAYQKDQVSFTETRMINAHVDYPAKKNGKGTYVNCFKLRGNKLNFLNNSTDGRLFINSTTPVNIRIDICDFKGNESTLRFSVQPNLNGTNVFIVPTGQLLPYGHYNTIYQEGLNIALPKDALYCDVNYDYLVRNDIKIEKPVYSKFHQVHNETVPLQKFITVEVQAENLPYELRNKAIVGNINRKGNIDYNTGTWVGDYLKIKTRNLGTYFITTDTTAPSVTQLSVPQNQNYFNRTAIEFNIKDTETGIKSYRGVVDGQWILFEYDRKKNLLYHVFDGRISKGKHTLELIVKDAVGNQTVKSINFTK